MIKKKQLEKILVDEIIENYKINKKNRNKFRIK